MDTNVRMKRLERDGADKVVSCPVGAPGWAKPAPAQPRSGRFRLLYYGNYIPLHGLEYVVANLAILNDVNMEIVFIGDGEGRPPIEILANGAGISSIEFRGNIPESDLIQEIHDSDVVLGVFGDSEKAATVLANKVWQGLAAGRYVVTRTSEALSEVQDIVGAQIKAVDIEDPFGLAIAIREIASTPLTFNGAHAELERYVESKFQELRNAISDIV
ncbi:glycosyltransferase family 4 protein [Arthrobacter sp. SF27]|nr:glycosyltransferase family 4 protein [Arthrobacter sp. SF27]